MTNYPLGRRYRFGNQVQKSLGIVELCLATPENMQPILVAFDVLNVDVP